MDLSIQKLSKAFNQKIVFQHIDLVIPSGARVAIVGANGSGTSTLLKILSGGALPSSGSITFKHLGKTLDEDQVYQYVHFVAPYNTVIEELTLPELFKLHQDLGLLARYDSYKSWIRELQYEFKTTAAIKTFSSGMKQRIKLGLALLDGRPLVLLDEPSSNLDGQGKDWLFDLLRKLSHDQTLIIATNEDREKEFCQTTIDVGTYSTG
jgi:ABC-type multidrug transport system ATPase subunit